MKKYSIPPEKYHEILKGLELSDVFILESNFKIDRDKIGEGLQLKLRDAYSFKSKSKGKLVDMFSTFHLNGLNRENEFFSVSCTFISVYHSDKRITKAFFDVYKDMSLRIMMWPYFREYINNVTSRMGLGHLVLPILKAFPPNPSDK